MSSCVANEDIPHVKIDGSDDRRPFRFKRHSIRNVIEDETEQSSRVRYRRRHHHGSRRGHRDRRRKLNERDESSDVHNNSTSSLPPDIAFRESLFDALGDDEGADFWQSVYGQPIHTYPRTFQGADTNEIETMDDEQYATYVRRRMWEKSAEGIQAAREERRRKEQQEANQRKSQAQSQKAKRPSTPPTVPDYVFDFELDASLRRGEDRKKKRKWRTIWQDYEKKWKALQQLHDSHKETCADDGEQIFLRNKIAWPVESGKHKDVAYDTIETFFNEVMASCDTEQDLSGRLTSVLKNERVKWHPDKIQQKFGFMHIEPGTMEGVTAVFQILDQLWTNARASKK